MSVIVIAFKQTERRRQAFIASVQRNPFSSSQDIYMQTNGLTDVTKLTGTYMQLLGSNAPGE